MSPTVAQKQFFFYLRSIKQHLATLNIITMKEKILLILLLAAWLPAMTTPICGAPKGKNKEVIKLKGDVLIYNKVKHKLSPTTLFLDARLSRDGQSKSQYAYADFRKLNEALANSPESDTVEVLIAPGVYWIDNPDSPAVARPTSGNVPIGMTVRCPHLKLTGLTEHSDCVVLASQRGQTQGAVGNFTMFDFYCKTLDLRNITMGNYCNVDLDYKANPALSRPKRSSAITQAQLAFMKGERLRVWNCQFISRLNLCPVLGAEHSYYYNSHFESTDDALNGNATYTGCDFDLYGQRPMYDARGAGATFIGCTFRVKHPGRAQYLTKSSSPITLIHCNFIAPEGTYLGWASDNHSWVRNYEMGVTLNGRAVTMDADSKQNTVTLNPDKIAADHIGSRVVLSNEQLSLQTGGPSATLKAHIIARLPGKMPTESYTWRISQDDAKYLKLSNLSGNTCTLTAITQQDQPRTCMVEAVTPEGLVGACAVTVRPTTLPAPQFKRLPTLSVRNGVAHLDYELELDGRADQSEITWTRTKYDGDRNIEIPVSVTRNNRPERDYRLTPEDAGYYLMATIRPKHIRSEAGDEQMVMSENVMPLVSTAGSEVWETDFHNFPCDNQPELMAGTWTIGGYKPADTNDYPWQIDPEKNYWRYGRGNYGCTGQGLLQTAQGARMVYTPLPGRYSNMKIELVADPAKMGGQGFSSATGQYMDIYIKYDTRTMTGYGLRIIRTTKHADAVDFMLMSYNRGKGTPLTEPLTAICYRTNCTITLEAKDGTLSAHAATTTPLPPSGLAKEVTLTAHITPNAFGGLGFQHTGTVGEGATMLHKLRVEWQ